MKPSISTLAICLLLLLIILACTDDARAAPSRQESASDCPALISRYERDESLQTTLIDPQLATQEEIDQTGQLVRELNACLNALGEPGNDVRRMLLRLTEYFLAFVVGEDAQGFDSRLQMIDLTTSTDPAVRALRERVNLPAPQGFVFLRYYPSRQAMPALVGRAFENPDVAGATFLTRYIAILDEDQDTWAGNALQEQALPATISHELVHAYLNASLGAYHFGSLPRWYHEGLAVYFSGSGEEHVIVTPGLSLNQTTSAEYKRFELIFEYLQNRLGEAELYSLLRQTVDTIDVSPLYTALDLEDERWLEQAALGWQARRQRSAYLVVLLAASAVFAGLYFLAPEYECACGHTGHRRDFPGGVCGECGRRIAVGQSLQRWKPLRLRANCQVCGRRFWRWQFDQLHFNHWKVRIWVPDEFSVPTDSANADERGEQTPTHAPPHTWVHRVCTTCAHTSQMIYQDYAGRMEAEVQSARQRCQLLYYAWLSRAPARPYNSFARQRSLYLSNMVDLCVQAALAAHYPDWVSEELAFEFLPNPEIDYTQTAPAIYTSILRLAAVHNGQKTFLLGSVGRMTDDLILIEWQPAPIDQISTISGNESND